MSETPFGSTILFHIGPLAITDTVVTSWGILVCMGAAAMLMSRCLKQEPPRWQTAMEGGVLALESAIADVLPHHARRVLPFIGTLWLFVVTANLAGTHSRIACTDARSLRHGGAGHSGVRLDPLVWHPYQRLARLSAPLRRTQHSSGSVQHSERIDAHAGAGLAPVRQYDRVWKWPRCWC